MHQTPLSNAASGCPQVLLQMLLPAILSRQLAHAKRFQLLAAILIISSQQTFLRSQWQVRFLERPFTRGKSRFPHKYTHISIRLGFLNVLHQQSSKLILQTTKPGADFCIVHCFCQSCSYCFAPGNRKTHVVGKCFTFAIIVFLCECCYTRPAQLFILLRSCSPLNHRI